MLKTWRTIAKICLAAMLLSGCSAMMLGGSGGTYKPPADECSERDRERGLC